MEHNFFDQNSRPGFGHQDGGSPGTSHWFEQQSDRNIDLNEQLIRNRFATFFMRVHSTAMSGAGINKGDIVIVDRALEPADGKIVIAELDGELLIRKMEIRNGQKRLVTATGSLSALEMDERRCRTWGVVTYVIHSI